MRTRLIRRSIATVTGVVALATVGALLMPTAAFANHVYVFTDSVEWDVDVDEDGDISDAAPFDFANDSYGWNDDAFDGFGFLTLTDTVEGTWDFADDDGVAVSNIVQGGTSVITMTGTTTGWDFPYTVVLTLTLEGNYAHWAYDISTANPVGLANSAVTFSGDLGSNGTSQYPVNSANTLVSHDASTNGDPVMGYNVVTDGVFGGWAATALNEDVEATADAASEFDVYLVLHGYTPCANGFELAVAAVTALVPTLPTTFGERYDDAGTCITVTPLSLIRGVPVNQVLVYTIDPALTTPSGGEDWWSIRVSYFIDELVPTVVDNLPAGLTAASAVQPDGSIVVTISGTPTTLGTFNSRLLFAQIDGEEGFNQIRSNFAITVADPPRPELAATGTDVLVPIGLASLLLLTGLGMAVIARRRLA